MERQMEQRLAMLRQSRKAPVVKAKPKPAPPRAESPFSFLGRLTISGVFGDSQNSVVMLSGGGRTFVAKGGHLFDENEKEVAGVSAELHDSALVLATAKHEKFVIVLPK